MKKQNIEILSAREYLTQLLIRTEGYDAVGRERLKKDLDQLNKYEQ